MSIFKALYIFLNYLSKSKHDSYWQQRSLCGCFTAFLSGIFVICLFSVHTTNMCKAPTMGQVLVIKQTPQTTTFFICGPIEPHKFHLKLLNFLIIIYFFLFIYLFLFKYSFLPFPRTPPQPLSPPHLPPVSTPPPLMSMCPL